MSIIHSLCKLHASLVIQLDMNFEPTSWTNRVVAFATLLATLFGINPPDPINAYAH